MKLWYELENRGSVGRDHLALERTFLAWMRTSLTLVSIGIAIAQLFRLPELILDRGSSSQRLFSWASTPVEGTPFSGGRFRMRTLQRLGSPIGILFVGFGILALLCGTVRFFHTQHSLIRGRFIPSRVEGMYGIYVLHALVFVLASVTGALLLVALGVMVTVATGVL